jgi:hypothetical protein
MDPVEIPLEPYDIDFYEPGQNGNPAGSGYIIRQEWYCPPPLTKKTSFLVIRDDWVEYPEINTHVRRIYEIEIPEDPREEDEDGNIQST